MPKDVDQKGQIKFAGNKLNTMIPQYKLEKSNFLVEIHGNRSCFEGFCFFGWKFCDDSIENIGFEFYIFYISKTKMETTNYFDLMPAAQKHREKMFGRNFKRMINRAKLKWQGTN